jgi:hypothetical protein
VVVAQVTSPKEWKVNYSFLIQNDLTVFWVDCCSSVDLW